MPKLFDFNPVHPAGRAVVNRAEFFQQFNVRIMYLETLAVLLYQYTV